VSKMTGVERFVVLRYDDCGSDRKPSNSITCGDQALLLTSDVCKSGSGPHYT